jgi:GT2 family glycosyltransferase
MLPGGVAFEVLVVDDPREDDPKLVAAAIGDRPYEVRQLSRLAPGVAAARNRGWRAARATLVLFLGDDVLADRRLLREHLSWHGKNEEEEIGILGHVRWARELRVTPFMHWLEHGIQFDYPRIRGVEAGWGRFYTTNVSVKRRMLDRVGGFDEDFPFGYEDLEIAKRMHEHGFRLLYNRKAGVEHLHVTTIDDWRVRMRQVAMAERRFVAKHPDVRPYFREMLLEASNRAPAHGWGPRLVRVVPRRTPWLGEHVWASADLWYRQQLAPAFLSAWEQAERGEQSTRE